VTLPPRAVDRRPVCGGGHPCLAKRLDTVVDKDETIW
jgi:hypothetical protein